MGSIDGRGYVGDFDEDRISCHFEPMTGWIPFKTRRIYSSDDPLMAAIIGKDMETVKRLADPKTVNDERNVTIVVGFDPLSGENYQRDETLPALNIAIYVKNIEVLAVLIENGADMNSISEYSNGTAVHEAIEARVSGILKLFLDSGANMDKTDRHGLTPEQLAETMKYAKARATIETERWNRKSASMDMKKTAPKVPQHRGRTGGGITS